MVEDVVHTFDFSVAALESILLDTNVADKKVSSRAKTSYKSLFHVGLCILILLGMEAICMRT